MTSKGAAQGKGRRSGGQQGLLASLVGLAAFVAVAMGTWRDRRLVSPSASVRRTVAAPTEGEQPGRFGLLLQRFDYWQQRHRSTGFVFAVVKKFADDRAGYLAALVSYYAFFSVFPLLLALTSILGFALQGNDSLRAEIEQSATEQIPIVGSSLSVGELGGSIPAIVVGLLLALWSGLRVIDAAQNALNDVWDIPMSGRPNIVKRRLRGLVQLGVFGLSLVGSVVASSTATLLPDLPGLGKAAIYALTTVFNVGVFLLAFKLLSERDDTWSELVPGAIVAAVGWTLLQTIGGVYIKRITDQANETYAGFASVIGLLTFFFLASQLVIFAAEINVVRSRKLWPRSLRPGGVELTSADRAALTDAAQSAQRVPNQQVDVAFDPARR